jgi:hypothetical protein
MYYPETRPEIKTSVGIARSTRLDNSKMGVTSTSRHRFDNFAPHSQVFKGRIIHHDNINHAIGGLDINKHFCKNDIKLNS